MANQIAKSTKQQLSNPAVWEKITSGAHKSIDKEQFQRCSLIQLNKNPKLQNCTLESFMVTASECAQIGLYPDGRTSYLIPYSDKCTFIIGYQGYVELVMKTGKVSHIHADIICENDDFECNMGKITKHVVNYKGDRGKMYAAYAYAKFKDGSEKAEVLSLEEIESIRNKSQGRNSAPWKEHHAEMSKKTAFRRLVKWLSLTPEVQNAISKDDQQFEEPKKPSIFEEVETVESTVIEAEEV